MNEINSNSKIAAQIVAVSFVQFNPADYTLIPDPKARIYFYLDPHGVEKGDFAIIHNDREFGMVHVERCISVSDPYAADKVTKPILGKFEYSEKIVSKAFADIQGLQRASRDEAIQRSIDHQLGIRVDGSPTEARIKRLGLFQRPDGSWQGKLEVDLARPELDLPTPTKPSDPDKPVVRDLSSNGYTEDELVSEAEAKRRYLLENIGNEETWNEFADKVWWRHWYFEHPRPETGNEVEI